MGGGGGYNDMSKAQGSVLLFFFGGVRINTTVEFSAEPNVDGI